MIKSKDFGHLNCISKAGNLKSRWNTSDEVIAAAKYQNTKYPSEETKLVGYKCSHCHYYHLTTVKKRQRNED